MTEANDLRDDDELSLYDLVKILRDGLRWVVGAGFLGVLTAVAYLAIATPLYEASAIIQVGVVGGNPSEPILRTIERLKNKGFQSDVLKALSWNETDLRSGLLKSTLRAEPAKNTDWIGVTVRAPSQEDTRQAIEGVVVELQRVHSMLSKPISDRQQQELSETQADIETATKLLVKIEQAVGNLPKGVYLGEALKQLQLLKDQQDRLSTLRRQETALKDQLAATTRVTQMVYPIDVSSKPVTPKKMQTLLLALVGGLFLGVVGVFVRRGWTGFQTPCQGVH